MVRRSNRLRECLLQLSVPKWKETGCRDHSEGFEGLENFMLTSQGVSFAFGLAPREVDSVEMCARAHVKVTERV